MNSELERLTEILFKELDKSNVGQSKEEKDELLKFLVRKFIELEQVGIKTSDEEKIEIVKSFGDNTAFKNSKLEEKKAVIEQKATEMYNNVMTTKSSISGPIQGKEFYQLPGMYHGITLNEQDIDLLNIVGCQTVEELREVARTLTNIPTDLTNSNITPENLEAAKRELFRQYLAALTSKADALKKDNDVDKKFSLIEKGRYLFNSGYLTEEEQEEIIDIIPAFKELKKNSAPVTSETQEANSEQVPETPLTNTQIVQKLQAAFGPEKTANILRIMRDRVPVEKSGVKGSTYEQYQNLYQLLPLFNSVTLDDEFKYSGVVLDDGTKDFRHFAKGLAFAAKHNMQVRGNSLISYMGCPKDISTAPQNEMKEIAKEKLSSYIDAMFTLLERNPGRVRSIDVFNELLNRTPNNNGNVKYTFRGAVPQNPNDPKFDDFDAGWYSQLELEEIFEIIATARQNHPGLQNVDFMYNEVFLEDKDKMAAFRDMMVAIKGFEDRKKTKLIDTLGVQLHIDSTTKIEDLKKMFEDLGSYGMPIEITEFDMTMNKDEIFGLTEEEIERLRQTKINDILDLVESLRHGDNPLQIKGFTIWSLTDTHNFVVSKQNEERKKRGLPPITTLHGGYFTEDMTPRGERVERNLTAPTDSNDDSYPSEQPITEENLDAPKVLRYTPPKPNYANNNSGFANVIMIAIAVGGFIGLLLAFIFLRIK